MQRTKERIVKLIKAHIGLGLDVFWEFINTYLHCTLNLRISGPIVTQFVLFYKPRQVRIFNLIFSHVNCLKSLEKNLDCDRVQQRFIACKVCIFKSHGNVYYNSVVSDKHIFSINCIYANIWYGYKVKQAVMSCYVQYSSFWFYHTSLKTQLPKIMLPFSSKNIHRIAWKTLLKKFWMQNVLFSTISVRLYGVGKQAGRISITCLVILVF